MLASFIGGLLASILVGILTGIASRIMADKTTPRKGLGEQ